MRKLTIKETQFAIDKLKTIFSSKLAKELNLVRVSAPLFVQSTSGLNDSLNGDEPVKFKVNNISSDLEIVHSLAKWKRHALKKYNFNTYEGIYTDMNAIRKEETIDQFHSFYVDQWDWELIIKKDDRNVEFLKSIVRKIYNCLIETEKEINQIYPQLNNKLNQDIHFISSEELYNLYPNICAEKREYEAVKKWGSVFIISIGKKLADGKPHSNRAKDYDDWNLNGDLIVYNKITDSTLELSSMGIRVNKEALIKQFNLPEIDILNISPYHQNIISEYLPQTIGGGIGQSRIAMFLLEKEHIGEVQVSVWDNENNNFAAEKKINLL
ncbi:aspartate--ammonia ligase [Metamycoplasma equirhinis]|uniref:aspartate--ammonia ligase n=1 Tax=Metamycoplasma equirhinis TaxID=92402 RepID=UPI0035942B07